jgi:hypothetical protein
MKFTIERDKWLHGEGSDVSCLLRKEDGKMCCLGFYALAAGLTEDMILEEGKLPVSEKIHEGFFDMSDPSSECYSLMAINDEKNIPYSEKSRERLIKESFEQFGIEVEFI